MLDCRRHPANSEFETLGDAARIFLDGLTLKLRAKGAATPFPANSPKGPASPKASRSSWEERREAPRFTLAGVKGRRGKSRE